MSHNNVEQSHMSSFVYCLCCYFTVTGLVRDVFSKTQNIGGLARTLKKNERQKNQKTALFVDNKENKDRLGVYVKTAS